MCNLESTTVEAIRQDMKEPDALELDIDSPLAESTATEILETHLPKEEKKKKPYMTVKDLITELMEYDLDTPVCYKQWSEHCLLDEGQLELRNFCEPRDDGWIHDFRPDKATQPYVVLP